MTGAQHGPPGSPRHDFDFMARFGLSVGVAIGAGFAALQGWVFALAAAGAAFVFTVVLWWRDER